MKNSIKVAIITGLFAISSAIISGLFSIYDENKKENTADLNNINNKETIANNINNDNTENHNTGNERIHLIDKEIQHYENQYITKKDDLISNDKEIENMIPINITQLSDQIEYIELNNNNQFKNPELSARLFLDLYYSNQVKGKFGICSIELFDFFTSTDLDKNTNTFILEKNTKEAIFDFINELQEHLIKEKYKIDTIDMKKYYILSDNDSENTTDNTRIFMSKSLLFYNQNNELMEGDKYALREINGFREFDLSIPTKFSGTISFECGLPASDGTVNSGEWNASVDKSKDREEYIEDSINEFIDEFIINEIMMKNIYDDYNYNGTIYKKRNRIARQ